MKTLRKGLAGIACCFLAACTQERSTFVTEHGLGPDKWATAWLLTRQVAPGAELTVVDAGTPLPAGTAFDVENAVVRRKGNQASFEVARATYKLSDPDIAYLEKIIHDIEVDFWNRDQVSESSIVEHGFRLLQRQTGRAEPTPDCYLEFFDSVYDALRIKRTTGKTMSVDDLSVDCATAARLATSDNIIPEMPIPELLAEIERGKSVVFVDVREANEFVENHIPGARNITLRDIGPDALAQVQGADYVVSYCVKDFRGFEMAKALQQSGVANSVILKPYGIKGWIAHGLPTAGSKSLSESDAIARLADCAASPSSCASTTAAH